MRQLRPAGVAPETHNPCPADPRGSGASAPFSLHHLPLCRLSFPKVKARDHTPPHPTHTPRDKCNPRAGLCDLTQSPRQVRLVGLLLPRDGEDTG
jgi:hypothetical protein